MLHGDYQNNITKKERKKYVILYVSSELQRKDFTP